MSATPSTSTADTRHGATKPSPGLIHGKGKDACPNDSFCLYRDTDYNLGSIPDQTDKILVIPSGTYINDFSEYGFDHSHDGVSSVVNHTREDNALFSAADQQGHALPVPSLATIADLRGIPMDGSPNGTWNDQAQSAKAAPAPVNLRVEQTFVLYYHDGSKYVFSYLLTLWAEETRVVRWALGFGELPEGSDLHPEFVEYFFGEVVENGSEGRVLLRSPGSGHGVEPDGPPLEIGIRVRYSTLDDFRELKGLFAQDLT